MIPYRSGALVGRYSLNLLEKVSYGGGIPAGYSAITPVSKKHFAAKRQANGLRLLCSFQESLHDGRTAITTLAIPIRPLIRVSHAHHNGHG
jgi:hypothetical protein